MRSAEQDPDARPATQRLGGGMIVAAWAVIIALLAFGFSGMIEQQHNPNQDVMGRIGQTGAREITLAQNRSGHYVATGAINGVDVELMLDTGATQVAIPGALEERLGLRRGRPMAVHTASGQTTAYQTLLKSLTLGTLEFHNVSAAITPAMEGQSVLLGMNLLGKLELVQRGRELKIRQY